MTPGPDLTLRCRCGKVECVIRGEPILTAVCYCDDCQAAAAEIEAAGNGPPVTDPDGGTQLTLVRKDRFAVTTGADRLVARKRDAASPTNRRVASCCNSAMFLDFDRGPFWVSALASRITGTGPQIDMRIQTKYRTSPLPFPDNAPRYASYPKRFIAMMMWEWVKLKLGR